MLDKWNEACVFFRGYFWQSRAATWWRRRDRSMTRISEGVARKPEKLKKEEWNQKAGVLETHFEKKGRNCSSHSIARFCCQVAQAESDAFYFDRQKQESHPLLPILLVIFLESSAGCERNKNMRTTVISGETTAHVRLFSHTFDLLMLKRSISLRES